MKIDVNGGYGAYRKKISNEPASVRTSSAEGEKKAGATDVLEISRGNTTIADKGFTALKANLQRDINQPASAERLDQIRAGIRNGTYRIPTEALVDSILSD